MLTGQREPAPTKPLMSHAVCHITSWQPRVFPLAPQTQVGEEEEQNFFQAFMLMTDTGLRAALSGSISSLWLFCLWSCAVVHLSGDNLTWYAHHEESARTYYKQNIPFASLLKGWLITDDVQSNRSSLVTAYWLTELCRCGNQGFII